MSQAPLNGLSEAERTLAFERFELLRPSLEEGIPLARVARDRGLALRTAQRWAGQYRREGLAGLARKGRSDRGKRHLSDTLRQGIEGLALKKPPLSAAAIHRQAVTLAERLGESPPTYRIVYAVINDLDPALVTLAHEGTKAYTEAFDLIHRHEATVPNAVWQADHTELDIWLKDGRGQPEKPWLTIILDDYSRAVAGYALSFSDPSAIQTALALRQAIWRKGRPGWQVCGIPGILYSDHGSDFTSQHLEQVAADLKIRLIHSMVGRPRGRGKIERFFESVAQVLLPRLPGYGPGGAVQKAELTLAEMATELERFLVEEYHNEPHTTTGFKPQERWTSGGFLPQHARVAGAARPAAATVPKTRRVHPTASGSRGCVTSTRRWRPTCGRRSCCGTTQGTSRRSGSSTRADSSAGRSARSWPVRRCRCVRSYGRGNAAAVTSAGRSRIVERPSNRSWKYGVGA